MTSRTPFRRTAALLAVLALGLSGCTTTTAREAGSSDGAGVIGVALPSTGDAAWEQAGDAVASELRDRGYRVDVQYAADDARTQASQVQNMLTKGMDAVIAAPLSDEELEAPADVAQDDGVPVLVLGRGLPVAGAAYAAVVEPEELGRAEAQALREALDASPSAPTGPVPVIVLAGDGNDAWEQRRYSSAIDTLAPAVAEGRIVIASGATWADAAVADAPLDVPAAAEKRVRDAGAAEAPAVAILALGDAVTRGVVTALTTDPPAPETASPTPTPAATADPVVPTVVGSGADLATVRALDSGVLAASVFVDTRALAVPIADAVEALLDDSEPAGDGTEIPGLSGIPALAIGAQTLRSDDIVPALVDTGWLTPAELSG